MVARPTVVAKSTIGFTVAPSNEDAESYISSSPVLKKWSATLNVPVAKSNTSVSEGLNVFLKMGTSLCLSSNSVLLTRFPLIES